VKTFNELNLSSPLINAIEQMGFKEPSPIQTKALPILLGGSTDFVGLAGTGTGKTAAFSIPLLERINPKAKVTQGLILSPTRELALQISGQIDLLGKFMGVRALPIYGGTGYINQIQGLRQGANIVVGTPGRIKDHLNKNTLKLDNIEVLILDEADEMISMGFKEDLEFILSSINRDKASIWLFSATMNNDLRKVAGSFLKNPAQVEINKTEVLSTNISQNYFVIRESDKVENLSRIIDMASDFYGIVFCQTKTTVANVTQDLASKGYSVDCLHGDKSQFERERTMKAFRDKKVNVLVCTDVASRGLDVENVTHVINYSLPLELEVYIHRIGRTARSGKSGVAISFVTPSQRHIVPRIERITKSKMIEAKPHSRKDVALLKINKLLPEFQKIEKTTKAMELFTPEWKEALASMKPEEVAARFINLLYPEIFNPASSSEKFEGRMEEPARGDDGRRRSHRGDGERRHSSSRTSDRSNEGRDEGRRSGGSYRGDRGGRRYDRSDSGPRRESRDRR
jgi:ATP-dependent RNA helicase DeaD